MVSSPGCSRIVPEDQNAFWLLCLPSTSPLPFGAEHCRKAKTLPSGVSESIEVAPETIARMTCIYYLSWDGSRFFDTSRVSLFGTANGPNVSASSEPATQTFEQGPSAFTK
jgi:hypothetical protein